MTAGLSMAGWGVAAPRRTVTNTDLEAMFDTSDEWIRSRSGIAERRWVGDGETTASLAADAVTDALKAAGRTPDELGLLVLATCTPDQPLPHTGADVCERVGATCGSFDLVAACTGFVDALVVANGLLATAPGPIAVVGSERMSSIVDPGDRSTAVLFGDGAAAVILEPGPGELLAWDAGTDGSLRSVLEIPAGEQAIKMDGGEVFRRAVRIVADTALTTIGRAGLEPADVDLFVPHQANQRIIEAACTRLGIPAERTFANLDRWGNTSGASIPIALAEAAESGRLVPGDVVLLAGFGAGMSWASALLRWA